MQMQVILVRLNVWLSRSGKCREKVVGYLQSHVKYSTMCSRPRLTAEWGMHNCSAAHAVTAGACHSMRWVGMRFTLAVNGSTPAASEMPAPSWCCDIQASHAWGLHTSAATHLMAAVKAAIVSALSCQ
jgi:hypothetical protein